VRSGPSEKSDIWLSDDWRMAMCAKGACALPSQASHLSPWHRAKVPTTAAAVLRSVGLSDELWATLFNYDIWWCSPPLPEGEFALRCEGLATIVDVWLDDLHLGRSASMFLPFCAEVKIAAGARLWLCCRGFDAEQDTVRPRQRWRTRLVPKPGLRGLRTTLMGQVSSFMPKVDAVGPWRPIRLCRLTDVKISQPRLHARRIDDGSGSLDVDVIVEGAKSISLHCAGRSTQLTARNGRYYGRLDDLAVEPWWPHTHGRPVLYDVSLVIDGVDYALGRCGFRTIEVRTGIDGDDFEIHVNGRPVFCRGASYLPPDVVDIAEFGSKGRDLLARARALGANMIRVPGLSVYPCIDFYQTCDQLGLLVWQDLMFATFDYPSDPGFNALVQQEVSAFLETVQLSPSLAVVCGGSETFQQATFMGIAPSAASHALFEHDMRSWVETQRPDTPYIANTPFGGELATQTDKGVSHYYGVGAYRQDLQAARRANVKFATECLAFANPPSETTLKEAMPGIGPSDAVWKAAVPRDRGADWDFEDVRDHYVAALHGIDPNALREQDPRAYLDIARETLATVMTRCFDEWRRPKSSCGGALVWLLNDPKMGAGWGILDTLGREKSVAFALKRAWGQLQLGLTDEGENGLGLHVVNETEQDQDLCIELICLREGHIPVLRRTLPIHLQARSSGSWTSADVIGSFFDITYIYRFGPLSHDCVVVRLLRGDSVVSERFYYPPHASPSFGNVTAALTPGEGQWSLEIQGDRVVRGIFIIVDGFDVDDDGFDIAPGRPYRVTLKPRGKEAGAPQGYLRSRGRIIARVGAQHSTTTGGLADA